MPKIVDKEAKSKAISEAALEELIVIPGINRSVAQNILDFFHNRSVTKTQSHKDEK